MKESKEAVGAQQQPPAVARRGKPPIRHVKTSMKYYIRAVPHRATARVGAQFGNGVVGGAADPLAFHPPVDGGMHVQVPV
jgi:hypothetical protein